MKIIRGILVLMICATTTHARADETIDLKKVLGTWEVTEFTVNGNKVPYNAPSDKIPAAYRDSKSREQYQITKDKLRSVSSDELAVTVDFQLNYHMRDNELVPENTKTLSMGGFNVLSVNDQTMVVGPTGEHSPQDLKLTLKRIAESELATNKLKPIDESVTMHLADNEAINDKKRFAAVFPSGPFRDQGHNILCAVYKDKPKNFALYMDTWKVQGDKVSSSSGDPNLSIEAHVDFDWSKPEEEVSVTTPKTSDELHTDLLGTMETGGIEFRLRENGTCDLHMIRNGRFLKVFGSCSGVKITDKHNSALSYIGNLVVNSNCVLSLD